MNSKLKRLTLALAGAALVTMAGCGGSGGGGGGVVADATTADVVTRVVDGPIENALVCLDKDGDGLCGAGEPSGRTDANGNLTLKVDKADIGKYALVTEVGTDAIDAENGGAVTLPFSMSAPPGKPAVISPLTTMVHQAMQSSGATEAEAEALVKEQTGVVVNLFEDFTTVANKAAAKAAGGTDPGKVARMIVITTQAQNKIVSVSLGAQALDNSTINAADLKRAVQKKLMQILPTIVSELNAAEANPANDTQKKKETALLGKISASLMTVAAVKVEVGIEKQAAVADPNATPVAAASFAFLDWKSVGEWNRRIFTSSIAQSTPDTAGLVRFEDRRARMALGAVGDPAAWNFGGSPDSQSNVHWTGTAWAACGINFVSTGTPRDAAGRSNFNFCNNYSNGNSTRSIFGINGETMLSVYNQMVAAGYTNLTIANAATALGSVVFPADSKIFYQTSTNTKYAHAYSNNSNSLLFNNPQSAGGDATLGAHPVCNGPSTFTPITTLEGLTQVFRGTPCKYGVDNSIAGFPSDFPNEVWGNQSLNIGTVGTAPVVSNPTSHYTGNTEVRVAFTGPGNEVSYYHCKQRQVSGNSRNCVPTGEKATYSIETLPDGSRILKFSSAPQSAALFTYSRTFIEREGKVRHGYIDKLNANNTVRLNLAATNALSTQLGMPTINPETSMALTAGSYQGTWIFNANTPALSFITGNALTVPAAGAPSCVDRTNNATLAPCTFSVTNPATGAFTAVMGPNTYNGTIDPMAATVTGTITGPGAGTLVGQRR